MSRQTVAGQTGLAAFELVPTEAHMFVKVYGECYGDSQLENVPLLIVCPSPLPTHDQCPLVTADKAAQVPPCQEQP